MSGENFLLLVRLGFSLSLVFGLMWVAAKVVRGRNGGLPRVKLDHLEVLERKPLAKGSSIAIVRVGGETLTVGVTEHTVTLLGHADLGEQVVDVDGLAPVVVLPSDRREAAELTAVTATAAPGTVRKTFLDSLRDKTVRHIDG